MDMLKIKSDAMNSLLSTIVTRIIRKRTNYDIMLSFQGLTVYTEDDKVNFQGHISGIMSKDDFMRLLGGKTD